MHSVVCIHMTACADLESSSEYQTLGNLMKKNLEHVIVPAFPNPSLSLSLSSNLFPKYALSNNHLFPYPAPMHSQASFKIKNHHDHYLSQRASKCIQFHSIFRSISEHPFRGTERFLRIQRKRGMVTRTVGPCLICPPGNFHQFTILGLDSNGSISWAMHFVGFRGI